MIAKNKIFPFALLLLCGMGLKAQFSTTAINWPTAEGGTFNNGFIQGYNFSNDISSGDSTELWRTLDINGDGKPDLVVTSATGLNYYVQFGAPVSPVWHVYLNTGSGFSTTEIAWSTPTGGKVINGHDYGFYGTYSSAANDGLNSQSWTIVDMDGDGKPDLVVTDQVGQNGDEEFTNGANTYWKVYLNTGIGFSSVAINWPTPAGGAIINGVSAGFVGTSAITFLHGSLNSQSWALQDLNGDNKPDLIITSSLNANGATEFNANSNPQWQVYLNTGSGFSSTPLNWSTPVGGAISNDSILGYNYISNQYQQNISAGSQTWTLQDIDGDNKADLLVFSYYDTSGKYFQFNASTSPHWQVYLNTGSGFSPTASLWSTPIGGYVDSSIILGFNNIFNGGGGTTNSQLWDLIDINSDKKPDLVSASAISNQGTLQYGVGSNPFWKVYLNTGNGFSSNTTDWTTPSGGKITGGVTSGFFTDVDISVQGAQSTGSQSWNLMDMNGDGARDLVVESDIEANGPTEFGSPSNPHWQVFLNTTPTAITNNNLTGISCSLYPNPNAGSFKLSFDDDISGTISVSDITGKLLIDGIRVSKEAEINLPEWAQGIYFVTVSESGLSRVMKVVVTK